MKIEKTAALTGHNGPIYALAPGRTGRHLFTAGGDGWLTEWSLDEPGLGRVVAEVGQPVFSLAFFQKENLLIAGDQSGGVRFVPPDEPAAQRHIVHHKKGVFGIQLIDGQLFTLGGDGLFTRWDLAERRPLESIRLSARSLRCAVFLEKRNELAIGSSDGNIYFLDAEGLFLKRKIERAHEPAVFSLAFLEEENRLASGGRDARLKFWDVEAEPALLEKDLPAHHYTINDMTLWQGRLATASRDRTVKIWDPATSGLLKVLDAPRHGGHFRSVNRLLAVPGGELVSAGDDRQAIVWRVV